MNLIVPSIRARSKVFVGNIKVLLHLNCSIRQGKMPPKKKEETKTTPLLGRIGTSLKCGIVGLPNVGYG